MGSRWIINGRNDWIDLSVPSSISNVPNATSSSGSTSDRPSISRFPLAFRGPLDAVQAATAQSHLLNSLTASSSSSQVPLPPSETQPSVQRPQTAPQPQPQLQPYSQLYAQAQTPGLLYGPGGGFSAYPSPPESHTLSDFMLTVIKMLETQSQKTAEALLPQFNSLRVDIDSLKTSFNQVREDVTKIRDDIQTTSQAQNQSDTATTKALKGFAEKAEALKAFIGKTQLSYENGGGSGVTVMGRLDEIYIALEEVIEKMADREADILESSPMRSVGEQSTGPNAFEAGASNPETPTPARVVANPQVDTVPHPSHRKTSGHTNQAPTPSPDVDMVDVDMERPVASTNTQPIEGSSNVALSFKPGAADPDLDALDLERSASPVSPRPGNGLESVSVNNWAQEGGGRPSTPLDLPSSETSANANARADVSTGTSPNHSHPPISNDNTELNLQETPQARPPSLAIGQPDIPLQQQPPTPISPIAFAITNSTYAHPLNPSSSITSIAHSLNLPSHSSFHLNSAEMNLAPSPVMSGSLLPELGYPTREPTVIPESDYVGVGENRSDIVRDEGEEEAGYGQVDEEKGGNEGEDVGEEGDMGYVNEQSVGNEVAGGSVELGSEHELGPGPGFGPEAAVEIELEVETEMEDEREHGLMEVEPGEIVSEKANGEVEMGDEREHGLTEAEPGEIVSEKANGEVEDPEAQEENYIQAEGEDHIQPIEEDSRPQLEEDSSRIDPHTENGEGASGFGNTEPASVPQGPVGQDRVLVAPKAKEPLFLPESRTGTLSPVPVDRYDILEERIKEEQEEGDQSGQQQEQTEERPRDEDEEREEQETSRNLLLSPEPSPLKPTLPRFAPPSSPQPQREPSPEFREDHVPSSAPPSPAPTSPIVRRKTPIIDISQVISSQPSQPQSSPCLSYADIPIEPDATSTPPATRVVGSISPEETAHILAQLTTLSEPSSSEDEESEEEEDQVDELLPSEPPRPSPPALYMRQQQQQRWRHGPTWGQAGAGDVQETFTTDATGSSIRTFTPQMVKSGGDNSIRSFGTVRASPVRQTARKQTGSKDPRKGGEREASTVPDERRHGGDQEYTHVDSAAVQPEAESHKELEPSPQQHSPLLPESAPAPAINSPAVPIPPIQNQNSDVRNDRNRPQRPVTPVPLPEYVSPVNSPSPSRSPLNRRSFGSGLSFGVGTRGGIVGRKRKLAEIRNDAGNTSTRNQQQQQQTLASVVGAQTPSVTEISQLDSTSMDVIEIPFHEREVLVRNLGRGEAGTNTPSRRSGPESSATRTKSISRPTTNRKKNDTLPSIWFAGSGTSAKGGGRQKKQRREESPTYISSTPTTPTEERGNKLGNGKEGEKSIDHIDLTGSPSPPPARARAAASENVLGRLGGAPVIGANPRKPSNANANPIAAGAKTKAQRERERKEEQERKEAAEREKREMERKRKREKEKKMLPIGAEDSDDAEIIPAKLYKKPQFIEEDGDEDESEERRRQSGPASVTAGRGPRVDLSDILSRRKANEKKSKAQTKVKRKNRMNALSPVVGSSVSAPILRSGDDGEPPLKKAKTRSADKESVVSGGSTDLRRSSRNKEEQIVENGEGKKKPNASQSGRSLGLGYDPPSSPVRISWPVKKAGSRFDKNFVECDLCNAWYHYGCVGIRIGDIRLENSEIFACPPCSSGRLRGTTSPKKGGDKSPSEDCGRPDCAFKTIPDEDEYFVKRIIGKRVKIEGGRGRTEEWLVEWEGYPVNESTWERETSMANPILLIEGFVAAAMREGWDLDEDPNATVLLKAARRAGFGFTET